MLRGFDKKFDKELNEFVVNIVQKNLGCFFCGKGAATDEQLRTGVRNTAFPDFTCSRCKVSRYCDTGCQKKDWKKRHKELCSTFCENLEGGFCLIECIKGSHWMTPEDFSLTMHDRQDAFFKAVRADDDREGIFFRAQVAVAAHIGQKVYLCILVSFTDTKLGVCEVNHLVYEAVDEGPEALAKINKGSGTMSLATFDRVIGHVNDFLRRCKKAKARVLSMTLGRGLVNKLDEFQSRLEEGDITMVPSADYAHSDAFSKEFM